jgi:hypothetical protein
MSIGGLFLMQSEESKKEITIIVTWPTSILQTYKQSGLKEENWSMGVSSNECSGRGMEIRS